MHTTYCTVKSLQQKSHASCHRVKIFSTSTLEPTQLLCLNQDGIQFLSDELSEVSRNGKLSVQFLRADFAAVSELRGKNLHCVLKMNVLFMFLRTRWQNCCLSSSYSALFSAEYRKSLLRNWTPPCCTQP